VRAARLAGVELRKLIPGFRCEIAARFAGLPRE
jgi:hypothetical protein